MKRLIDIGSPFAIAALIAALFALATPLRAQDTGSSTSSSSKSYPAGLTSSSVHESTSSEIPRIWGGITGSYLPFKLVSTSSTTNSTTGETVASTTANGQAGAGLTFNVRLFGPYWLNIGGVYRFGGYDTFDGINNNTIYLERTRARYLDFPVLIRYAGPHFRWSKYSFYEVGGALRYATHINLTQAASNGTNYYCCAPPSTTSIKRTIEGVVVGTGITGKDDFGIVVSPEVRYTRWMGDTFRSPTVSTMRDQLEVTISFGF
ncbi:MAG TPA: hypothetical protein VFA65_23350 [Bryobacteraceae bacterium]|nr:hypothetical protein [Bryobacteraceae bacterium]